MEPSLTPKEVKAAADMLLSPISEKRLEEIGDRESLMTINWLKQGLKLSRAVARIVNRTTGCPLGTGFLIAPNLLMTNYHVIPDPETANKAIVHFNYELTWDGRKESVYTYWLRANDKSFKANSALDYAIIPVIGDPGIWFGFIDLLDKDAVANITKKDSHVNIIQHPGGSFKQIALTDNRVIESFGDFIQYTTKTRSGSSGSPVFNQAWKLVALHHRGKEKMQAADGTARPAQQGVKIEKIIQDLGPAFQDDFSNSSFLTKIYWNLFKNRKTSEIQSEIQGEGSLEYELYAFLIDIELQESLMEMLDKEMSEDGAQQFAEVLLDDYPDVLKLFDKIQAASTAKMVTVITPAIAAGVVCARRYPKETEIRKSAFVDALALDHLIAFIKQKLDTPDFIDEPIILRDLKDQSDEIIQPIIQEIESQQNQPIEPLSVNVKNPNNFQIDLESLKMVALLGFRIGFTAYRRAFPQPLP